MTTDTFRPDSLDRRDTDRMTRYRTCREFYDGLQWETSSRQRQLVFNYAKTSVDKVTSYLIQGLSTNCTPLPGIDQAAGVNQAATVEHFLSQVREDNQLDELDWETEVDCAILGDACYKVTWDADASRVRVTAPPVTGIYAWWLGDDPTRVWRVASRYQLSAEEVLMLHGVAVPKNNAKVTEVWTTDTFQLYIDNDLTQQKPNPYGFIPFVIFPNLRQPKHFWGSSDIPQVTQPQRELNRALSQLSRILEFSGNPIAVLENVDSAEDIETRPGQTWALPEGAKAYLLDLLQGGGIRLHMDYIDTLYRALNDLSETPRAAYGGIDKELSGAALNIELGSLVQKVTRKRTIRTAAYNIRDELTLRLATKFLGLDSAMLTHRVAWGPILPEDKTRQAQNEQLLVQAGVHSRRTAMDTLGVRNPNAEFDRWLDERKQILNMNNTYRAQSTRGGPRERAIAGDMEVPE